MEKRQSTIDPHIDGEELQSLERRIASLAENIERLQEDMVTQAKLLADLSQRVIESRTEAKTPQTTQTSSAREKPVTPDVLVIIAAAVSAYLGKKIRIRSARMLQSPYEIVNPWSQQGRVSVQASHSLRWER
jgi:methylmalonyl-CoA carboxyltransferase large subunit